MEATPEFTYHIEHNPEPEQIGKIEVYSSFVRSDDMEPILTRCNFSCSLPANEFIDEEDSPHKQRLYYFLTDSGVDVRDALKLIQKLTRLALEVTSSFVYRSHYALVMWLTLDVAPLSIDGSFLDDSQVEEVIQASLDEYDERMNREFRHASKLRVEALSRRIYKKKQKTSSIANKCTRYKRKQETCSSGDKCTTYKRKQETCSSGDKCTICLEEFKTGREVATLLCGHEFDYKCIMEWCKFGHVCPLCRFELPCEDGETPQTLTNFSN